MARKEVTMPWPPTTRPDTDKALCTFRVYEYALVFTGVALIIEAIIVRWVL